MDITKHINKTNILNRIYLPEIAQQFAEFRTIIWLEREKNSKKP